MFPSLHLVHQHNEIESFVSICRTYFLIIHICSQPWIILRVNSLHPGHLCGESGLLRSNNGIKGWHHLGTRPCILDMQYTSKESQVRCIWHCMCNCFNLTYMKNDGGIFKREMSRGISPGRKHPLFA